MADKTLDLRGLVCPRPMVMTLNAIKGMEKGQIIEACCTDAEVKQSIPELCERSGYDLLSISEENDLIVIQIRK